MDKKTFKLKKQREQILNKIQIQRNQAVSTFLPGDIVYLIFGAAIGTIGAKAVADSSWIGIISSIIVIVMFSIIFLISGQSSRKRAAIKKLKNLQVALEALDYSLSYSNNY